MKIEDIEKQLKESISELTETFARKHNLGFEFYIADDIFSIAHFGDTYFFNISDIYFDVISKQPKGQIIDWLEDCLENQEDTINYKSYAMGLRFEHLNKKK